MAVRTYYEPIDTQVVTVRLPVPLVERLDVLRLRENRSRNKLIEVLIEEALAARGER